MQLGRMCEAEGQKRKTLLATAAPDFSPLLSARVGYNVAALAAVLPLSLNDVEMYPHPELLLGPRGLTDHIDPRGVQLYIIQIVLLALTWLFFGLRALVKLGLLKKVSLDDCFMLASMVRPPSLPVCLSSSPS